MVLIRNAALEKLRDGSVALGFGLYDLRGPAGPGIAHATGHDWVFIDSEHGPFSLSDVADLCMVSLGAGVSPIVRVTQAALDEAARALDNGAQGVIVAMVESADEARRVVDHLRYPPLGRRGWGGSGARHGYLPPTPAVAMQELNDQTLLIVMIETKAGVEQAHAIAAVHGVDALFVGLADLSTSLGIPGRYDAAILQETFATVADACAANDLILGMGGIYDDVIAPRFIEMGARLIATGNDHGFLMAAASARAALLRGFADRRAGRQD